MLSSPLCRLFSSCSKQQLVSSYGAHVVASLCGAWALGHASFKSFSTWAQSLWLPGPRTQPQQLWLMALKLLCSMWDLPRPGTEPVVSCISRWILYHWDPREALWFTTEDTLSQIFCSYLIIATKMLHIDLITRQFYEFILSLYLHHTQGYPL